MPRSTPESDAETPVLVFKMVANATPLPGQTGAFGNAIVMVVR
jgi:hypothetical protein